MLEPINTIGQSATVQTTVAAADFAGNWFGFGGVALGTGAGARSTNVDTFSNAVVPEPASAAFLGTALGVLAVRRRRH